MSSYDSWKTRDGDDPGRMRYSEPYRSHLTCRDCAWRPEERPIVAHAGAVRHAEETGHTVLYKGRPQQFAPPREEETR